MLTRYKMYRGKRPAEDPLPDGIRQDTRKHTGHILRPSGELVARYFANPTTESWQAFKRAYLSLLEKRFAEDRARFDELAALARDEDVYLGCNCPSKKNPDVSRCHTTLALRFMRAKYRRLIVHFPGKDDPARPRARS